jgi:hypothetical protein
MTRPDAAPNPKERPLEEYAQYAAGLIGAQADGVLEDVSGSGFRSWGAKLRGHLFEGKAFAQRGYRDPNTKKDTYIEVVDGNIVNTRSKETTGIKFPVIAREHTIVMQGVHMVLRDGLYTPGDNVAYRMKADLQTGDIAMAVKRAVGSPTNERLTGESAWQRALPLLEDLHGALEGKDPYRARGIDEPVFPTFDDGLSEEALEPYFEERFRDEQRRQGRPGQQ